MLEILQIFIDNILPILIIAGIGALVGRQFNVDPRGVSTLMFYIFSPALVFTLLINNQIGGDELIIIFVMTIGFQLMMMVIAFGAMRLQGAGPVERSNVMVASFCLNAGNYGLSMISFAFDDVVLARASVVFIANVFTNYSLGVYVASNGRKSPIGALGNVFRTPAVYALIAATLIVTFNISIPPVLENVTASLGEAALPLMIVLLGLQLGRFERLSKLRFVITGVSIRLLLSPFIAFGLVLLFGLALDSPAAIALILQMSMPTAIVTLIFSIEFELDRELALNMIMASTLLSPVTLSILIFLLG